MSHENGNCNWMNSDQRDATTPHECFGFNEDSTHCGQCSWPLQPGFRISRPDIGNVYLRLDDTVMRKPIAGDDGRKVSDEIESEE